MTLGSTGGPGDTAAHVVREAGFPLGAQDKVIMQGTCVGMCIRDGKVILDLDLRWPQGALACQPPGLRLHLAGSLQASPDLWSRRPPPGPVGRLLS